MEVNELWGGGGIRRRVAEMWEHLFLTPDFWTGMYCSESGSHCSTAVPHSVWYGGCESLLSLSLELEGLNYDSGGCDVA